MIGHNNVIRQLQRMSMHPSATHAVLLAGPRGAGKHSIALALASALGCTQPKAGDACGDCASCVLTERPDHPDIIQVTPSESRITIDEIRIAIRRLDHRPTHARRRLCVIPNADRMTEESANALLKTLEEPPGSAVVILTAEHLTALPATITSRCAAFQLGIVPTELISAALTERGQTKATAAKIATVSQGRPGFAFFLAEHPELLERVLETDQQFLEILNAPIHTRIRLAEELADSFQDQAENTWERWEDVARRLLRASLGQTSSTSSTRSYQPIEAYQILSGVIEARRQLSISSNPRVTLEHLFLHLPR